jgi:hypothetical protein
MEKLKLEILDPLKNVEVTHYVDFIAGEDNNLRLSIAKYQYLLDNNGKLITSNNFKELQTIADNLKQVREWLQNNSLGEVSLSNLPQFFWEEFGENINDIEDYIKKRNQ